MKRPLAFALALCLLPCLAIFPAQAEGGASLPVPWGVNAQEFTRQATDATGLMFEAGKPTADGMQTVALLPGQPLALYGMPVRALEASIHPSQGYSRLSLTLTPVPYSALTLEKACLLFENAAATLNSQKGGVTQGFFTVRRSEPDLSVNLFWDLSQGKLPREELTQMLQDGWEVVPTLVFQDLFLFMRLSPPSQGPLQPETQLPCRMFLNVMKTPPDPAKYPNPAATQTYAQYRQEHPVQQSTAPPDPAQQSTAQQDPAPQPAGVSPAPFDLPWGAARKQLLPLLAKALGTRTVDTLQHSTTKDMILRPKNPAATLYGLPVASLEAHLPGGGGLTQVLAELADPAAPGGAGPLASACAALDTVVEAMAAQQGPYALAYADLSRGEGTEKTRVLLPMEGNRIQADGLLAMLADGWEVTAYVRFGSQVLSVLLTGFDPATSQCRYQLKLQAQAVALTPLPAPVTQSYALPATAAASPSALRHTVWGVPWGASPAQFTEKAQEQTGLVYQQGPAPEGGGYVRYVPQDSFFMMNLEGFQMAQFEARFSPAASPGDQKLHTLFFTLVQRDNPTPRDTLALTSRLLGTFVQRYQQQPTGQVRLPSGEVTGLPWDGSALSFSALQPHTEAGVLTLTAQVDNLQITAVVGPKPKITLAFVE